MSQPYIGEIRLFGGTFAPNGWMFCAGQTLPISEFDALYNLIGTTYGGDGMESFQLPDLRGRIPMHAGAGPSGSQHGLGERSGTETVTLTEQQIPTHRHPQAASTALASSTAAEGGIPASWPDAPYRKLDGVVSAVPLAPDAVAATGASEPHENMPPFLGISFIISLYGIYPSET